MSNFKCTKKVPCKECPFKPSSLGGWLGPDKPQEVLLQVHGEGGYPCHMSTTAVQGMGLPDSEILQCCGAVLHATKSHKSYRPGPLADMQRRLEREKISKGIEILGYKEFLEHHDLRNYRKGKKK